MRISFGIALLIAGYLAAFWGGFCLMGGPDARFLSRDSLSFGIPCLAVAALLIFASTEVAPAGGYVYAPLLVPFAGCLIALAWKPTVGVRVWCFGALASSILTVGYRLSRLVR